MVSFQGLFTAMVTIQSINLKRCTQSWSQSRSSAGASMFICGYWVDLSSDARAKQQTLFQSFLFSVAWITAASPRQSTDRSIMISCSDGSVFDFVFRWLSCFDTSPSCGDSIVMLCYAFLSLIYVIL